MDICTPPSSFPSCRLQFSSGLIATCRINDPTAFSSPSFLLNRNRDEQAAGHRSAKAHWHFSCETVVVKMTWTTVALFDNLAAAQIFEAYLRDKRMDTRTFNDKFLQAILFLCRPRATYRVQVRDHFSKMATEILKAGEPPVLEKAIRCPDCGSLRINYPQMTRRFLLPTVFLHLGIIFRIIHHQAYCEACHCMWSLPKAEHPPAPAPIISHPHR